MTEDRITSDDLAWWLDFAAEREWTFAKTYATTAPHHYVVQDRTPGVSHDDVERAARVIHTFGAPGKYYAATKIYLVSPDQRYRWWTEDRHFTDATLVNRATTDRHYGVQNAPSTTTGIDTEFDEVATTWDGTHPSAPEESRRVAELLSSLRGKYPPHVLDVGCGTGRVLDLGLVSPDRYAGVDFSRAMLNTLIRKHPKAAAVYPADFRELLATRVFTPGQFDWVFLDTSVALSARQRAEVKGLARLAMITTGPGVWNIESASMAQVVDTCR